MEIQHIPGKKNPADALTRTDWSADRKLVDTAKREDSELVRILRLGDNPSDRDIQIALDELFVGTRPINASLRSTSDHQEKVAKLLVTRTSITVEDQLKRRIQQELETEESYKDIIEQLTNEVNEVQERDAKYRLRQGNLMIHKADQPEDSPYWRLVVPNAQDIKTQILEELHSVPYAGHPGYTRTLELVRTHFYWVAMARDVRRFVEECPVCQVEKGDHTMTRGRLQPLQLPEKKWEEVMIDFIFKLPPTSKGHNGIMVVIDRATKMTHLIPCDETATASDVAYLYWSRVGSLHGLPHCIYSDRDVRFTGTFWRSLWAHMGTELRMSTAFHPQTQGLVERTNQTCEQVLRCLIHEMGEVREWDLLLPMVEFVLNSYPNRSTGYSPFYLNWGYHPVTPQIFLRDQQPVTNESVAQFMSRMDRLFTRSQENVRRANQRSKANYDRRRREAEYAIGDRVLLSTEHLHRQGTPQKLQRKFVGPFPIIARHGTVAYELKLPSTWKRHPVFHVSLLKKWKSGVFVPSPEAPPEDEEPNLGFEDEEPVKETEKILRWRIIKRGNQRLHQFLVTWKGRLLDEAEWVDEEDFEDQRELAEELERDNPVRDPSSL